MLRGWHQSANQASIDLDRLVYVSGVCTLAASRVTLVTKTTHRDVNFLSQFQMSVSSIHRHWQLTINRASMKRVLVIAGSDSSGGA